MAKVGKKKSTDGKTVWFVDYTFKGQRKKIYGFNSRDEALFVKSQIDLRELDSKTGYRGALPTTLEKAVEQYKALVSSKKNPDTRKLEVKYFDRMLAYFKDLKEVGEFDGLVSSITLLDLEKFRNQLTETQYSSNRKKTLRPGDKDKTAKPLKAATVNRHFNTFGDFFTECRKWNFIVIDPTMDLDRLAEETPKKRPYRPEQVGAVLKQFDEWVLRIVYFIAKTAARRGEACRLEPKDVRLEDGFVVLKSWKGGKYHEREIPLTDEFYAFMAAQLERARKSKSSRIFTDDQGMPVDPVRLSTQMHRAARRAGVEGMNLHALRHTLLSQLASQNVSLRKIQAIAGHRNLTTTQKYLHIDRDSLKADLQKHEDGVKLDIFSEKTSPKGLRANGDSNEN